MKNNVLRQLIINYIFVILLIVLSMLLFMGVIDFANHVLAGNLVKDKYNAQMVVDRDFDIDLLSEIASVNGGIYFVSEELQVEHLRGIDPFKTRTFDTQSWTKFLTESQKGGVPYNINVSYSNLKRGWVIVVFPTSLRIEFGIVRNLNYVSVDREAVWSAIAAASIALILFISLSVFLLSKFTSYQFIRPLKTLKSAVSQIKEGHYDHRVEMSASKEFTDVAELFNQMAAQVESKQQKLISSEQHRQQLILDISHDLRNPLSVILGCSSLLKSPELTSEQSFKYASMIENHGLRAKDLIDQLFDLSRLQSVDFRLSLTEVEVFEWLRKRIATQIGVFEQGGYDYQVLISEERLIKSVDVFWLERVIFNLLDNTMRHNHPPLTIMIESYQDENAWVICISDDGIGVDPEMLEGIFDRYVSPSGGSGLGLAIAKKAVEAHGGSIRCINREKQGCTFEIRLP
ncbi:MAG: hypothetical protein CVU96_05785 [Firmicutes bacterium HGW-Firmicutes-20]|nr:MAG: hypothetical protein CVU96_05785 [Firmicutes bacterium HGW-Firmicutes-20]